MAAKDDEFLSELDDSLADAFAVDVRDQFLYDARDQQWFVYGDGRWTRDITGDVDRRFRAWMQARSWAKLDAAKAAGDLDRVRRAVRRNHTAPVLRRLLELAQTSEALAKDGTHWHAEPFELATSTGHLINLRTGGMRPADPFDFVKQTTSVPCDPAVPCDRWRAFVREVMDDDGERVAFLHRFLGYCLTGDISEQMFTLLIGGGSNGKSTFLELVSYVLGAYAGVLPFAELVRQRDTRGASPEVAKLVGLRLVRVVEFPAGVTLDVARIKSVTGGDTMSTRGLYKDPFDFTPTFKLLLCANDLPHVRDTSHAYWRRAVAMPFDRKYTKLTADAQLKDRLRAEAPGILAWMVEGCLDWQKHGLPVPAACVRAAADWREQDDPIAPWVSAEVVEDADGRLPARDAYAAFLRWCERERLAERERPTSTAFGKYLGSRFKRIEATKGRFYPIRLLEAGGYGGFTPHSGKYPHTHSHEETFHKGSKPSIPSTLELSPDDDDEFDPGGAFGPGKVS